MQSYLFDDHSDAYLHWWHSGKRGMSCLHVDAHLDLMEEGFSADLLAGMNEVSDDGQMELYRDSDGPFGQQLHCANYLFPALQLGLIGELVWLVPNHMWQPQRALECALELVSHWIDIPTTDLKNWNAMGSSVVGTLYGQPFAVCAASGLREVPNFPRSELALDIDVDYFIRCEDDVVWSTPYDLRQVIPGSAEILTVALSTVGGYTPVQEIFLGEACLDAFSEGPRWELDCRKILRAGPQGWESLLGEVQEGFRPALLARMGRWQEAQALDSRYLQRTEDLVCRLLEKGEWEEGLRLLLGEEPLPRNSPQLVLYCLSQLGRWGEVVDHFEAHHEALEKRGPEGLKIRHLVAQAYARLQRPQAAEALLREAMKASQEHHGLWFELARCQWEMGQAKKAARSLTRSLRYGRKRAGFRGLLVGAIKLLEKMNEPHLLRTCRRELDHLVSPLSAP